MKMNEKQRGHENNIIKYEYESKSSIYKKYLRLKSESHASLILSAVFHMGMKNETNL